jgi:galactitol-specific phosphotransferase system IIC component
MFLFVLLPVLVVVGIVLIAGPALLPFAVIAAVGFVVTRLIMRHRHPDQSAPTH